MKDGPQVFECLAGGTRILFARSPSFPSIAHLIVIGNTGLSLQTVKRIKKNLYQIESKWGVGLN